MRDADEPKGRSDGMLHGLKSAVRSDLGPTLSLVVVSAHLSLEDDTEFRAQECIHLL